MQINKLLEGGNVFKGPNKEPLTQRINRADIPATVSWLEQVTGLDFSSDQGEDGIPLRWLGSTGRKPTSGDLDLAVDLNQVSKEQLAGTLTQFVQSQGLDPREWVKKGGEVHFRTPIAGDSNRGFVQTDFMFFPNLDWGQFYYSGGTNSEYKGMTRAVLMSSIAKKLGLKLGANGLFSRETNQLVSGGMDPDHVATVLLGPGATRDNLKNVESIYAALSNDPDRDVKLKDFREYLAGEGLKEPELTVRESDANFLARLRDRIVNQGMRPLIEAKKSYRLYETEPAAIGGEAKGIEHLEDYIFRSGSAGVDKALAIADAFYQNSKTGSVKWDGIPALVFGRKPDTGEFVLTDDAGFSALGYDGLFTSTDAIATDMARRDANAAAKGNKADRIQTLLPTYETVWPYLEAATPENFRGYVKGDLLYTSTPPVEAGNLVFQPNTVAYRIPVNSKLGQQIANSEVGVAVHTMYADAGAAKQPLSRVKFNPVQGLLLIEPIYAKPVPKNDVIYKQIKTLLRQNRQAIDTLFNPTELRAMKITDLAKLAINYINKRVDPNHAAYTGDFRDLVPGFMAYLQQTQTPQKVSNIAQYLRSPTSNEQALAAAFLLFELLHDLKLDLLGQLDAQVPGNEGWVFATPAGYGKAVNRFDFTARNKARNNPPTR
jgi:Family of unknown function (DUF6267)